jgi:hypothetical protein
MRRSCVAVRLAGCAVVLAAGVGGAPQPRVRPVVDARSGYLLGGTVNGAWRPGEQVARLLRGRERYRVYGGGRLLGESAGTRPKSIEEPCPDTYTVELSPARPGGAVAVGGAGNALPRPVARLDPAAPAYVEAVRRILVRNGIRNPAVRVTGVTRVDLEGDGADEVIVSAHRGRTDRGIRVEAGEYSLLFVRRVVAGAVRTVMLEEEYHPKASDEQILNRYSLAAVLDLDGDGVYEIVTRGQYYEGDWATVYRLSGLRKQELAGAGCGV